MTKKDSCKTPTQLKKTQEWFASIISRPIDSKSHITPSTPSGNSIKEEAKKYITPSASLESWQRIELYNQQYWWRLLSILHENFPFVTALLGYRAFNERVGFPYLSKYPSDNWSLNDLGNRLPKWIQEDFEGQNRDLLYDATCVDAAFNDLFFVKEKSPLTMENLPTPNSPSSILEKPLHLQPYIVLFSFPYNLLHFRNQILVQENADFWQTHNFPTLNRERNFYFILFRNRNQNVVWDEITKEEHQLLSSFQTGATLEKACSTLEGADEKIAKQLPEWFQSWVEREWLTLEPTV